MGFNVKDRVQHATGRLGTVTWVGFKRVPKASTVEAINVTFDDGLEVHESDPSEYVAAPAPAPTA